MKKAVLLSAFAAFTFTNALNSPFVAVIPQLELNQLIPDYEIDPGNGGGGGGNPPPITPPASSFVQFKSFDDVGNGGGCGLDYSENLWCGAINTNSWSIDATGVDRFVNSGFGNIAYINTAGDLYVKGNNSYGELGLGNSNNQNSWVELTTPGLKGNVQEISFGGQHSMILDKSGNVWVSGWDDYGELGLGGGGDTNTFVQTSLTNIKKVIAGAGASYALGTNGTLYAVGINDSGDLGTGDWNYYNTFQAVLTNVSDFEVALVESMDFYNSVYAINSSGELFVTGLNDNGQLGLGNKTDINSFQKVSGVSGVEAMAASMSSFMYLKDGDVYFTGGSDVFSSGTSYSSSTTFYSLGLTDVNFVSTELFSVTIIKDDFTTWRMGSAFSGLHVDWFELQITK